MSGEPNIASNVRLCTPVHGDFTLPLIALADMVAEQDWARVESAAAAIMKAARLKQLTAAADAAGVVKR